MKAEEFTLMIKDFMARVNKKLDIVESNKCAYGIQGHQLIEAARVANCRLEILMECTKLLSPNSDISEKGVALIQDQMAKILNNLDFVE